MTHDSLIFFRLITVALFYASIITFLPWDDWRGLSFADIANYTMRLEQIERAGVDSILRERGIVASVSREYLWALLLSSSIEMGLKPEAFFQIITFLSSMVAFYFISSRVGLMVALIVMINPISIDLYNSQLRSALAFSLFLIGASVWMKGQAWKWLGIPFLIAALFIHTSMIIVSALYVIVLVALGYKEYSSPWRNLITISVSIVLSAAFVLLGNLILSSVGDRRVLSEEGLRSFSFLIFWLMFAGLLLIQNSPQLSVSPVGQYSLAVLSFSLSSEFMGVQAFRFIAMAIPVIFATIAYSKASNRFIMVTVVGLYNILLFTYWLRG